MQGLAARVYMFSDIPSDTLASIKEKFKFASFVALPDSAAPEGAFADFWKPQHYGWKLWIYNQLSKEPGLAGRMVLYMDAGAFLCRWPITWLQKAQDAGLCFLEDPREENRRWCSPEFCAALKVTEAELAAQQTLGGLVAFRCGATSTKLFEEALALAYRREVLVGEKWAGQGADGRPFGHRHDQSILSILGRRAGVATEPLDTVYCDKSLRKTFNSGKCIYVHRGQFAVHVPFSEGIDDAYVINLERRADRLEKLWANSPELKGRVERWPAVDGRALTMTPAIATIIKPNDFLWKKAITGCALSHLGLWWKLANETSDIESYLILEDDVKFKEGWEKLWRQAVAADAVPEDCDIIYLGGVLPPNREGWNEVCKERVNDFFCRVKENTMWGQDKPNRYFHFCAYSYILSKKGAQKVIDIIRAGKGLWTSADHILCNPVDVLKGYVMDPIVAGCYQDDDPKYATSQFNDFSRIDGFDSDLWNNDERFSEEEKAMAVEGGVVDFKAVLEDAKGRPAPTVVAAAPAAPLSAPRCGGKPVVTLPRKFICMDRHALKLEQLHEADWLMALFGSPTMFSIETVSRDSPPLQGAPPVFIIQKPHIEAATTLLTRWSAAGAKFIVLHLSDETLDDPVDIYELPGCEKVLRFYIRYDLPCAKKVTTIPLGFHWTLRDGSKNPLTVTPRLPFRELVWSFHGTNWGSRKEALKPLTDMSGTHLAAFYDKWLGAEALGKEQYISTLLNTVFVPCPEGVNGETFRFYEALECGCIPLIVRTPQNTAWVDWVQEHLQIIDLPSWEAAAAFVDHLMSNKEKLEKYRGVVLESWVRWRAELLRDGADWLKV
jgi:GR25 family glycosyltransferase involved in LPS biosynthesis